jgi:RecA-family ATPase
MLHNVNRDYIEIHTDIGERIQRTARGLQVPLGFQLDNDMPLPAPVELVKGTMSRHGTGVLGGQSGTGKTFVAVHLMVCAATAKPFLGREIREPIAGIYLAAEGSGTIAHRFAKSATFSTRNSSVKPSAI